MHMDVRTPVRGGIFWGSGLGGCRTFGIEAFSKSGVAKFDPSEGSFCRICWLIAVAMGQKDGKK